MALIAAGCKGCGAADDAPTAIAEPARSDMDRFEHRIATLKIDLKQTFPKRDDGVVDCGSDADCFLVMAHRCEPALLDHELSEPGILAIKKVRARYRITGGAGDDCRLLRLVLERDMVLPDEARKALLDKGKTAAEIDAMQADAVDYLKQYTPERSVCSMARSRVLGLALALVTQEPTEVFFRPPCHDPREGDAWPDDLAAPDAAAAAPEAAPPAAPAESGAAKTPAAQ